MVPMPGEGSQQLEHSVVVDRFSVERVPDDRRKVVVADARSIRIAMGTLLGLGSGPHADTAERCEPRLHRRTAAYGA